MIIIYRPLERQIWIKRATRKLSGIIKHALIVCGRFPAKKKKSRKLKRGRFVKLQSNIDNKRNVKRGHSLASIFAKQKWKINRYSRVWACKNDKKAAWSFISSYLYILYWRRDVTKYILIITSFEQITEILDVRWTRRSERTAASP